jgi:hypothetical protein
MVEDFAYAWQRARSDAPYPQRIDELARSFLMALRYYGTESLMDLLVWAVWRSWSRSFAVVSCWTLPSAEQALPAFLWMVLSQPTGALVEIAFRPGGTAPRLLVMFRSPLRKELENVWDASGLMK